MKKGLFILIYFLFILNKSYSQASLDSLFKMAEKNSATLYNIKLDISLSGLKEKDAKESLLPNLELGGNYNLIYGLSFDQISGMLSTGNNWSRYLSSNLSANISSRNILSYNGQITKAKLAKQIATNDLTSSKIELKNIITLLYFEVVKNNELIYELEDRIIKIESTAKRDSLLFALGKRSREEILIGEMKYINARGAIDSLTMKRRTVLSKLETLCGRKIELERRGGHELLDWEKYLKTIFITDDKQGYRKDHPSVVENKLRHLSMQQEIKLEKLSRYPEIILSTAYGTSFYSLNLLQDLSQIKPFSSQISDNKYFQYYVSFRYPISNIYKGKGRIKEKEIEAVQINNKIKELEKESARQKDEFRLNLLKRYNSVVVMEKQIEILKEIQKIKNEKYDLGLIGREELEKTSGELDGLVFITKSEKLNILCAIEVFKNTFFYEN